MTYDVTDEISFKNVSYWLKKINKHGDVNVKIMLLGNKVDLFNERAVTYEEADELCRSHGIPYYETSAKDATNVDEAFKFLISGIISEPKL